MLIKVRGKKYRPEAFFMIAPVILLYTFVIIYPLGNMVFTSFFEWNGIPTDPYRFVGIGNYVTFFQDYTTKTAFINLGILCVTGLFVTIPVSLFLATVVSKKFFGIRFVKTCYFLPVVINRIAICLMFTFIMLPGQGPVPVLLKELGIAEHFNLFNDIHTGRSKTFAVHIEPAGPVIDPGVLLHLIVLVIIRLVPDGPPEIPREIGS